MVFFSGTERKTSILLGGFSAYFFRDIVSLSVLGMILMFHEFRRICNPTSGDTGHELNHLVLCLYTVIYTWSPSDLCFLKVNPPKQGLLQPKQSSFGFQVYIYRYVSLCLYKCVSVQMPVQVSESCHTYTIHHSDWYTYLDSKQSGVFVESM